MKSKLFITGILVAFIVFACKEQKKSTDVSEDNSQMEQVMAIHDEVMPKMSTIGKLVGELKSKSDSTELGQKYQNAMTDLQDAHKAMMDWMQGFGDRFDSDEILNGKELTAEKKEWLNEEEEKVKALKEQINRSIENAEKILEGTD
ncbi:MAG: hypothetical protein ABF293_09855 [Flavobacteriaceae bacterium]